MEFLSQSPKAMFVLALLLAIILFFLWRWMLGPAYKTLRGMWNFWRSRKNPASFLEITPPKHSEKSPLATEQLFAILQTFADDRYLVSLEIISTRKDGIRYLVRAHPGDIAALQRQLASYLPEARFKTYRTPPNSTEADETQSQRVYEIKQWRHHAYPLTSQSKIEKSDPVDYLAGSMTKLQAGESITLQMVVAPHHSYWTTRLANKIHHQGYATIDKGIRPFIKSHKIITGIAIYITIGSNIWFGLASIPVLLLIARLIRPEVKLSSSEKALYESMQAKLDQPLFRADIRAVVIANDDERRYDISQALLGSFAPYSNPGYQSLRVQRFRPDWLGQKIGMFKARNRMPSFIVFRSNVLAASELASIYHFPFGTIKTEGMARSHSRTLPATLGMKNNEFDVVFGQNNHHGELTPIGLTADERERHAFIIGGTGNGKTTMLQYAIVQDIQSGKGVAVVDPHGDMAETLLRYIPEERINDVIYFNPDDLAHPIGVNLLELRPGLEGDELLREKDVVTESVVSVFRKVFSEDDSGGHRIEYVLRNTIQTALHVEGATLFTVYDLLNDPPYRKQVLKTIDDRNLQNFWKQELGKAGDMQKVKMAAGITAKIGRFLFSASAKRVFEQPRSTINFDEILDGKILICNFSKGLLGEDTSELFGVALLAKLQLAALQRARVKQADRKPFYLYVDEFQNFATPSFVQLLSEARKYKFYLTMAEQSTSQQDDQQMVNIILANVGTIICFRSGNPADEKLVLPLFEPYIEKGEIANLPSYNFYMRVSAQKSQEPLSGETVIVKPSNKRIEKILATSRRRYSKKIVTPTLKGEGTIKQNTLVTLPD